MGHVRTHRANQEWDKHEAEKCGKNFPTELQSKLSALHKNKSHYTTTSSLAMNDAEFGIKHLFAGDHFPPSVVNLNHACEKASSKACWSFANSWTIRRYAGSSKRATSLVNLMMLDRGPSSASATLHCQWPPGPMCFSHF